MRDNDVAMQQETSCNEAKLKRSEAGNGVLQDDIRSVIMTRTQIGPCFLGRTDAAWTVWELHLVSKHLIRFDKRSARS
jgi:hypothetical protein